VRHTRAIIVEAAVVGVFAELHHIGLCKLPSAA